jgi:hypothetical protein
LTLLADFGLSGGGILVFNQRRCLGWLKHQASRFVVLDVVTSFRLLAIDTGSYALAALCCPCTRIGQ